MKTFLRESKSYKFKSKVDRLKYLLRCEDSGIVELANEREPIRLGGGLAQLENNKLILVKRDENAPRMPLTFDIPAGVYDELWENPLQMMMAESVEILRLEDSTLYYPSLGIYDSSVLSEIDKVRRALHEMSIEIDSVEKLNSKIVHLNTPVEEVAFREERLRGLGVAFEYEGPSIELIGVIQIIHEGAKFKYADGELISDFKLLNREIHVVDRSTLEDAVWRLFSLLRKTAFIEELQSSKGLTSKAARVLVSIGMLNERDPNLTGRAWDLI